MLEYEAKKTSRLTYQYGTLISRLWLWKVKQAPPAWFSAYNGLLELNKVCPKDIEHSVITKDHILFNLFFI